MAANTYLLVRYGWAGELSHFSVADNAIGDLHLNRCRGLRVVVETPRGLELGECLAAAQSPISVAGALHRIASPEDELLQAVLVELGQNAFDACQSWLSENQQPDVLLSVEPLLDGRSLIFNFLSDVSEPVQSQIEKLTELYEQSAGQHEFVQKARVGCGPNCGTAAASSANCGSSCSNCKSKCAVKSLKA